MKKFVDTVRAVWKGYYHLIVFAAFFLFEAYGISSVVITGDDYYYANFLKSGLDYFMSENAFHYMETNGRAFIHLLDEIFLAMPLTVWKLVELFSVSAIVWLSATVAAGNAKDEKRFQPALVISCVLFSMIDLFIMKETVLWATGSFNYVLPVLLVLVLYHVYTSLASNGKGAWYLPVLAFFAAFTMEQSAFAVVMVCIFVTAKTILVEKRGIRATYILTPLLSIAGFLVLFISPGNSARKAFYPEFYSQPLPERLISNARGYLASAFETSGMLFYFVILFAFSAFAALSYIYKMNKEEISSKNGKARMFFNVLVFVCSTVTATALVLYSSIFPGTFIRLVNVIVLVIVTAALIIVMMLVRFLRREDDGSSLIFAICAVATFGAMIFVPIHGSRMFFAPIVFMFVPIIRISYKAFEVRFACSFIPLFVSCYAAFIFSTRYHAFVVIAYTVFLIEIVSKLRKYRPSSVIAVCASFVVLFSIGRGYAKNTVVHQYNDAVTKAYAAAGDISEPLVLSYPIASSYTYSLPYSNPYHEMRYKQYYGIPEEAKIVYKNAADIDMGDFIK